MARSQAQCADDRELMYDSQIRKFLGDGDDWKALQKAVDYLLSEAHKRRDDNAGDGAVIAADVARVLRHMASSLPGHPPARPPGCPRVPRPVDLLAVYDAEPE